MGGKEHGETLAKSCTNDMIYGAGELRLVPQGATAGGRQADTACRKNLDTQETGKASRSIITAHITMK